MIEIALYQPDIAPNAATILQDVRLFRPHLPDHRARGLRDDAIPPSAGPAWTISTRRPWSGMPSWAAFRQATAGRRSVLLTTRATLPYWDFAFRAR